MLLKALVLLAVAVAALAQATADSRYADNLRLISEVPKRDSLVPIGDHNFAKLVLGKHRPYHTIVLFTTANTRGECSACDAFAAELSVLAYSYELVAPSLDGMPVFFVRALFHENQQTFKSYDIRGVPMLAYYAPTTNTAHPKSVLPAVFMEEVQEAEKMAQFVRGYSGVNIEVYRSPVMGLVRLFALLSFVGLLVKYAREQVVALVQYVLANKFIWMVVSLGIYFISVSGVLYDVIRGVPWVGADNQGNPVFISGSGSQYVLEGLFIGVLNIGCAASILLLKSSMASTHARTTSSAVTCLMYGFGFVVLYKLVQSLYRNKNRWY